MASVNRALVRLLPTVPKPIVRRLSERYIAGAGLADAARAVAELNQQGMLATVDVLGEEISSVDEAAAITREYEDVLEEFDRSHLDSNISVKLTAFGLKLDLDLCRANLHEVVDHAARLGNFVRIDMEDSSTTDDTLDLYRELRAAGRDNVGVVLQAALRRTVDDVEALADLAPNVRICKGIYVEPEEIAFLDPDAVRASYVRALNALLDARCYVGIATHDEWLVDEARKIVSERELGTDRYEFQMLLGVRAELGRALVREGHRLRIYVPYGRQWYEYSLRRLQENPKIAGYVAADTLGRLAPRRRREHTLSP